MASDVFQQLAAPSTEVLEKVVARLEQRRESEAFNAMRDQYLDALGLRGTEKVLDLGCGTGAVARALAARPDFEGEIRATDYSEPLIEAARSFAQDEGVADQISFGVDDALALDEPSESFDVVLMHTLISHVPDPVAALGEAARVARRGGRVVVFDGDYASLVVAAGHPADQAMTTAILEAAVANPSVLRDLPRLLVDCGLGLDETQAHALVEVGDSSFFAGMAHTYVPIAGESGRVDAGVAQSWTSALDEAHAAGVAFGSCNYITYLATKPT